MTPTDLQLWIAAHGQPLVADGAIGLVEWVGKHWPFTAFAAAAAAFVAWATGKLGG